MAKTTIPGGYIEAGSIDTASLADNAIDATKIASNSILTRHIDDDQITGDQLADAITVVTSVTTPLVDAAILDGENFKINGAQGTDGQVLTSTGSGVAWEATSVADGAITSAKLDTNIAVGGTLTVTGDANFDSNTLFVDASANAVGIGTASPTTYLDVRAPAGVPSPTVAYFKSDQHGLGVYVNIGSTFSEIRSNNNSYPLVLNASSGGNVGIGTSLPEAKLDVKSTFAITEASAANSNSELTFYSKFSDSQRGYVLLRCESLASGSSDLAFRTRNNFVEAERLRIQSGGGISFNGDTAAANALDDYEEGTWTPVLNRVGASTLTYTSQTGYYTKIGRQVIVNFYIVINAVSAQGSSVNYISGLPFTIGGVGAISHAGSLGLNNGFATAIVQTTMGRGTESNITFHDNTNAAANLQANWVAGGIISGTLSYFID